MGNELINLREDSYTAGSFEFTSTIQQYDYSQLDYEALMDIYLGKESTGMQYGGVLAQMIVDTFTAFELAQLPMVMVKERTAGGVEVKEMSLFSNQFLKDQHSRLLHMGHTKNVMGDGVLAFNLDRNLESIPPNMVDLGWSPYNQEIDSATVVQNRYFKDPKSSRKAKGTVTRLYDSKNVTYTFKLEESLSGIRAPKTSKSPNPFGICPIVHIPNLPKVGMAYGFSDFYTCIPYFILYHRTLARGFEAQQYSGRPILVVTNIPGMRVDDWIQQSFGLDPKDNSANQQSKVIDFFNKHKILALSGDVKAEFIESKAPTGKTQEILSQIISQISRLSALPEFLFGATVEGNISGLREQYARLNAHVQYKQAMMTPYLIKLIKMAMVYYTTVTKNEETGELLETYGLVKDMATANKYEVRLIWPELLGTAERNKIEALTVLANAGAVSRQGLVESFPQYFPSAETELERLEDESTRFAVDTTGTGEAGGGGTVPEPQSGRNANERRRKSKTAGDRSGDNADGQPTGVKRS